jgi:NAD(P)-dependent dehydrogenase (short-subunit alcohol dehydrogenase family)
METKSQKIVVVTGASAGVGRAVAHEFGRHGATVALIARGREALNDVAREVESRGGRAIVLALDVSSWAAVREAADRVVGIFGRIDVWVNNAMVSVFSPVAEMKADEYRRVTEVTYLGTVHGTLAALAHMKPRNRGAIIQVGSALAYRSIPLQSAYCGAKHAVLGFTESLRVELLHDKSEVTVSMVELPAVNTPQFRWVRSRLPNRPQPVPPIFQPELIARAVYWTSQTRVRETCIAFPSWKAIFAEKWIPSFADRYLARYGYKSQQTDQPVSPDRRDNLYSPLPQLASTHGDFDAQSREWSLMFFWIRCKYGLWSLIAHGI